MAEVVSGTSHSGAHVDALAHMTIGEDDHWYGGGNAREHLGDRGPKRGDGAKLPPFVTRGVLLDVPAYRGIEALPAHEPVTAEELQAVAAAQGTEVRARRRRPDPVGLPEPVARPGGAGPARHRRPRHQRGAVAAGPGRRRGGQRHGDLRGAAGPRPRDAGQPAAGAHPAAHRERHLPVRVGLPGGDLPRAGVRVPVHRPPAEDRGHDRLDAGPAGRSSERCPRSR